MSAHVKRAAMVALAMMVILAVAVVDHETNGAKKALETHMAAL